MCSLPVIYLFKIIVALYTNITINRTVISASLNQFMFSNYCTKAQGPFWNITPLNQTLLNVGHDAVLAGNKM